MEEINKFLGGMNQDSHPTNQPENTVTKFLNFVPVTKNGNLYSVSNEKGTVLMENILFPSGMKVIGSSVLNTDIIVCLVSDTGVSQIGVIMEGSPPHVTYGNYHPIGPVDNFGNVLENNKELGWSIDYPLDVVSRKLISGERVIYYTNNNTPVGRISLENPPVAGSVASSVKLVYDQIIPYINIKEVKENVASTIKPGVVQFVSRYVTEGGGVTTSGLPSDPFPVVPTLRKDGANNYHGEFNEFGTVSKNIVLEITNVDTKYKELELIAIYYEGSQSTFTASIVGQIPITSGTLTYTYTGPATENEVIITREELRQNPVSYDKAKCIEQKNNTLFLSNVSSSRDAFDKELQEIANAVRVGYKIDEIQFSGRGSDAVTEELSFNLIEASIGTINTSILVKFNKEITAPTATDFIIHKLGTVAEASIQVTPPPTISALDQIQIGAGPSQLAVNFVAETVFTGAANTFLVTASATETATNLAEAINNSSDVSQYSASAIGDTVTLLWIVPDLTANSVTVTFTGSPSAVSLSSFAGATTTPFSEVGLSVTHSGSEAIVVFTSPVYISDSLEILTVSSIDGDVYSSGLGSYVPIVEDSIENLGTTNDKGFTDYTNEELTVLKKGYRRGESYSLGFMLLYKDGTTSYVYHIPGFNGYVNSSDFSGGKNKFEPIGADVWGNFNQFDNSTGKLGTYVSTVAYPTKQNYPGNVTGDDLISAGPGITSRNIRHHLMPSIKNEPTYRVDANNVTWLRVMGLTYNFTKVIPNNILDNVSEILFVRERRNSAINSSVLSQGVINRQAITADSFGNDGKVAGTVISGGSVFSNGRDGYYATEIPYFDNMVALQFSGKSEAKTSGHTRAGIVWPNTTGPKWTGSYGIGEKQSSNLLSNRGIFHSPETELLSGFSLDPSILGGAKLEPVLNMIGDYKAVNYNVFKWKSTAGNDWLNDMLLSDLYADYRGYETSLSANSPAIVKARNLSPGNLRESALDSAEPGIKTGTRWTSGGTEFLLDSNLTSSGGSEFALKIDVQFSGRPWYGGGNQTDTYNTGAVHDTVHSEDVNNGLKINRLRRLLYNVVLNNVSQYDQISNAAYIVTARKEVFDNLGNFNTNYSNVYGGDTFITKFAYTGGQLIHYTGYDKEPNSSINRPKRTHIQRSTGYGHIDGINRLGNTENIQAWGADLRWNTYFFVESNINTHFRHRDADETKQNYFPNTTNISVMLEDYRPYLGNVSNYNTQYSYENNVKEFFTKNSTETLIAAYENRTIYSEQASSADTLDSYRSFLQQDFYDLPSDSGPIWDSFVAYGTLFLHTPKSLWRTFSDTAATLQGGNITEVVLGTGSLFARPSQQVTETKGGYGGSISQFGGIHTPIGYIFPDILQGKVFLLGASDNGVHLKDISAQGLTSFFHNNLQEGIIKFNGVLDYSKVNSANASSIDNPFKGIGVNGGYDYALNRAFFVKQGGFTLTFSTVVNNWFSFHNYMPTLIIPLNNRVLFVKNNGLPLWEMNLGDEGTYFGVVYPSEIEFICNGKSNQTKVFQNLVVYSDSYDNGNKVRSNSFKTLQISNDRSNSGVNTLVNGDSFDPVKGEGEVFVKQRNDEYRIALPRDAVKDNSSDLFDVNNVYIPQGGTVPVDEEYYFKERIKGDYAKIKLVYDNSNKLGFVLNYISTIFNNNLR